MESLVPLVCQVPVELVSLELVVPEFPELVSKQV